MSPMLATKKRRVWAPRPIILLVLIVGAAVGVARLFTPPDGRVYGVPEVQVGLRHHPGAWVGRTIFVQGAVETINQYITAPSDHTGNWGTNRHLRALLVPTLLPMNATTTAGGFGPQLWADPRVPRRPLNAALRLAGAVPVLGSLIHVRDQRLAPGQTAIFRVTVLPTHRCPAGACMSNADVILDDVQP